MLDILSFHNIPVKEVREIPDTDECVIILENNPNNDEFNFINRLARASNSMLVRCEDGCVICA